MLQEVIREDLKKYLKENGIKNKFIAEKIEISTAMISYFINGRKNLSSTYIKKIEDIIYS